jgi:hypothetical protein
MSYTYLLIDKLSDDFWTIRLVHELFTSTLPHNAKVLDDKRSQRSWGIWQARQS